MRLKKILLILGILILVVLATSLLLTYIGYSKAKKIDSSTTFKDYFPFGKGGVFDLIKQQVTNTRDDNNTVVEDEEPNSRLILVSEEPVAGFSFIQKEFYPEAPIETEVQTTVTVNPVGGPFTTLLEFGSKGEDVRRLQATLNACPELGLAQTGPGSAGKETIYFVERTFDAVKRFQNKFKDEILTPEGLTSPTGIVDELTRKKLSEPFVCKTVAQNSPQTKPGAVLKTVIRFVEKATGNVYDFLPPTKETVRLTNQTIPRIHEAFFTDNGNKIFIRYLKEDNQTIETYVGTVPKPILGGDGSPGELSGFFMDRNIVDISLSPKNDALFYQTTLSTNSQGTLYTPLTDTKKSVFSSPFSEWLSQWVNENTITMTTKASGFVPGHMYAFDLKSGEFKKVFGDIYGLTTNTNPALNKVLFSTSSDRTFIFGMRDLLDGKNYSLQITTLPEKCTWSKTGGTIYCGVPRIIGGGVWPDEWYQGIQKTSDYIVRVDPTQLYENEILVDPEDEDVTIDVSKIDVDSRELYTAFIDKKSGKLYMINN